jgi:hypothetical protein
MGNLVRLISGIRIVSLFCRTLFSGRHELTTYVVRFSPHPVLNARTLMCMRSKEERRV